MPPPEPGVEEKRSCCWTQCVCILASLKLMDDVGRGERRIPSFSSFFFYWNSRSSGVQTPTMCDGARPSHWYQLSRVEQQRRRKSARSLTSRWQETVDFLSLCAGSSSFFQSGANRPRRCISSSFFVVVFWLKKTISSWPDGGIWWLLPRTSNKH